MEILSEILNKKEVPDEMRHKVRLQWFDSKCLLL